MTYQNNRSVNICLLTDGYIDTVVRLHEKEINYGFGSYLGKNFLRYLYKTIMSCEIGFGMVAVDDQRKAVGFIAATTDLGQLYKTFIRKYSLIVGFLVLPKLFSWKAIKSIYQDLLYPSEKTQDNLPHAEIISMVVLPDVRGQGVGRLLMQAALEELGNRSIKKLKVLVGDKLPANDFYRKMGFNFITHITYNSEKMDANVYVKDLT